MKVRLKATLERELADYLEHYRITHKLKTRSEAIEEAIHSLRRAELQRDAIPRRERPSATSRCRLVGVHQHGRSARLKTPRAHYLERRHEPALEHRDCLFTHLERDL